jgi:hypothetical protein
MDILGIVFQLVGGAAGGNGIAAILKKLSSGPVLDTILGLVGGFAGGQLAGLIPGLDASAAGDILGSLVGGGIGGGALTAIFGLIRNAIKK